MARILITEDEDSLRSFVARALRLDGHETHEAADGAEGLEKLSESAFDLLLSDIRMPVMDGIELAHRAHSEFPEMKILLMTGYAEQRERADDHNEDPTRHEESLLRAGGVAEPNPLEACTTRRSDQSYEASRSQCGSRCGALTSDPQALSVAQPRPVMYSTWAF